MATSGVGDRRTMALRVPPLRIVIDCCASTRCHRSRPEVAGETAFMLANEQGKQRAGKDGSPRPVAAWKVLFLSTGEIGLEVVKVIYAAYQSAEEGRRVAL